MLPATDQPSGAIQHGVLWATIRNLNGARAVRKPSLTVEATKGRGSDHNENGMLSRQYPFGVIIPFVEFVAEVMGWERWPFAADTREF